MTDGFNIGKLHLANPTVLAPMAGVTDTPFRRLVKETGCALVCSEMVSANGLIYGSDRTGEYLIHTDAEKPLSIQLFGKDPAIMAAAAVYAAERGADIIDINFGCSVKKVLRNGYGAALMKDPKAAEALLSAVRAAITVPLTIKIRTGWDQSGKDALELSRIAEGCGVDALCIHPRTARQLFRGAADWNLISEIKCKSAIPVIGNGDILEAADALRMIRETGCDAVMIGRAALSNPWIFAGVLALMENRPVPEITVWARHAAIRQYIDDCVACYGEHRACRMLRSRLGWLVKGLPNATRFRDRIKRIGSREEAGALLEEYFGELETGDLIQAQA